MPYVLEIVSLLKEFQVWILTLIGVVTGVVVTFHGLQYQGGNDGEKQNAVKKIRGAIMMGGGIFFLVWLVTYIITKMSGVNA